MFKHRGFHSISGNEHSCVCDMCKIQNVWYYSTLHITITTTSSSGAVVIVAEAIVVVVTAIVIVYYVQFRKLTLVCVTVIYLFVLYP
jgi:hypothetical protein